MTGGGIVVETAGACVATEVGFDEVAAVEAEREADEMVLTLGTWETSIKEVEDDGAAEDTVEVVEVTVGAGVLVLTKVAVVPGRVVVVGGTLMVVGGKLTVVGGRLMVVGGR